MSRFAYSGTGETTAITTGSGGMASTDTAVEVDAIPSDLSQGDTVKVALGGATAWQSGSGETVHGTVGTIGGGTNGGTNITGLSRGQEGTTAAVWAEGDTVRVGIEGRDDVRRNSSITRTPGAMAVSFGEAGIASPSIGGMQVRQPQSPTGTLFAPISISRAITVENLAVVIGSGGTVDGTTEVGLYDDNQGVAQNLILNGQISGEDTSGVKKVSFSQEISAGYYWLAVYLSSGYTTTPTFYVYKGKSFYSPGVSPIVNAGGFGFENVTYILTSSSQMPDPFGSIVGERAQEAPVVVMNLGFV